MGGWEMAEEDGRQMTEREREREKERQTGGGWEVRGGRPHPTSHPPLISRPPPPPLSDGGRVTGWWECGRVGGG